MKVFQSMAVALYGGIGIAQSLQFIFIFSYSHIYIHNYVLPSPPGGLSPATTSEFWLTPCHIRVCESFAIPRSTLGAKENPSELSFIILFYHSFDLFNGG